MTPKPKIGAARGAVLERLALAAQLTHCKFPKPRARRLTFDWALAAAEVLGVDPRWLWSGQASPAAAAAVALLKRNGFDVQLDYSSSPPAIDVDSCTLSLVGLLEQPVLDGFVCRYCGCTDDNACAEGCGWADARATICTACLEIREEVPA